MGDTIGGALVSVADASVEKVGNPPNGLATERLILRRWRAADVEALAVINADAEVMRHFSAPLTREQTVAMINGYEASFAQNRFGPWAVCTSDAGMLIGLMGLLPVDIDAHFAPAVNIVAKFASHAWRQGYALEAADAVFRDGFGRAGLDEIVAFTARRNEPSWRLMAAYGMTHDESDDFAYPGLAEDHPYRDQVLYRMRNPRNG